MSVHDRQTLRRLVVGAAVAVAAHTLFLFGLHYGLEWRAIDPIHNPMVIRFESPTVDIVPVSLGTPIDMSEDSEEVIEEIPKEAFLEEFTESQPAESVEEPVNDNSVAEEANPETVGEVSSVQIDTEPPEAVAEERTPDEPEELEEPEPAPREMQPLQKPDSERDDSDHASRVALREESSSDAASRVSPTDTTPTEDTTNVDPAPSHSPPEETRVETIVPLSTDRESVSSIASASSMEESSSIGSSASVGLGAAQSDGRNVDENSTVQTNNVARSVGSLRTQDNRTIRSEESVMEKLKRIDYSPQIAERGQRDDSYAAEGQKILPSSTISGEMTPVAGEGLRTLQPSTEVIGSSSSTDSVTERIERAISAREMTQPLLRRPTRSDETGEAGESTGTVGEAAPNAAASPDTDTGGNDVKSVGEDDSGESRADGGSERNQIPFDRLDAALSSVNTRSTAGTTTDGEDGGTDGSGTTTASTTSPYDIKWEDEGTGRTRLLLEHPEPSIPNWVSEEGLRLKVVVSFVLTPEGVLTSVKEEESDYSEVAAAVVEAVRRWRFVRTSGGKNVKGRITYLIVPS